MRNDYYWLWLLSLEAVGNQSRIHLLDTFKSPEAIYKATPSEIEKIEGLRPKAKKAILTHRDVKLVAKAQDYMDRFNIYLITREDTAYPHKLRDIYNPPVALFAKGDVSLLKRPLAVGVVGSRKASPGGVGQARHMGQALSEMGVTVISGLARGIDAASHEGGLTGIGSTIAVIGTGINICYPKVNKDLFRRIAEEGLILSEFFMDAPPLAFHFPLRNRLVSGLSDGLLVVEAAEKSGALITARHAMEQGKNVYAIPKDISQYQSVGVNTLIKDGAKLVTSPKDILEDFVDFIPTNQPAADLVDFEDDQLTKEEKELIKWVRQGYNTIDQLVLVTAMDIRQINGLLSLLELKDCVSVDYGTVSLI